MLDPYSLPVRPLLRIGCAQANIHLIELEGIFFAAAIGRYDLVAIQDIISESRPFGLGQAPGPFHEAHRTESEEGGPRLKTHAFASV